MWKTVEATAPGTCHLCGEAIEVGETVRQSDRYGLEHPGGNRNGQCGKMIGDRTIGEAASESGPRCIWTKVAGEWAVLVETGAEVSSGDSVQVIAKSGRSKTVTLGDSVGPNRFAVAGAKKSGSTPKGGARKMAARFPGKCKACGGRIHEGDEILYTKGEGATHADVEVCHSYAEQASELAMERAAEAQMYGEVA